MPVITFTADRLSDQVKKELIQKLAKVSVEVTGKPEQAFTILIHELDDGSIGCGTKTLAEIKASR